MKKKLHHGTKDLRAKKFATLGAGIYFSQRKNNLYTSNTLKQEKGIFTMNVINNEQLNFDDVFKFAKLVLETAGLTGNKLAIGLDKIFKHYTGISALETAGVQLEKEEEYEIFHGDVGDEFANPEDIIGMYGLICSDPEGYINETLEKAGYQHKVGEQWLPTELGKKHSIILEKNMQYLDGTPVREVLWNTDTIDFQKLLFE